MAHEPAGPSFVEPPAAITTAGTCGCTASSLTNHCRPPWPCTRHDELSDLDISPGCRILSPLPSCSRLSPSQSHAKSLLLLLIAHFREDEEDISRPTCSFNKTSCCILRLPTGVYHLAGYVCSEITRHSSLTLTSKFFILSPTSLRHAALMFVDHVRSMFAPC